MGCLTALKFVVGLAALGLVVMMCRQQCRNAHKGVQRELLGFSGLPV